MEIPLRRASHRRYLLEFGVDAVAVDGGLEAWHAAGLPTVDAFEDDDEDEDDVDAFREIK